jgi:Uma2 family endonuclease
MNERVDLTLDKATFLDWVERQDGRRYELVRGKVVQQQAGGTSRHSRIANRIGGLLDQRLDRASWAVTNSDFAVDVDNASIRFPEVCVIRLPADSRATSTDAPVVLVEVLSPSSVATDFGAKANEYLSLASLEAYVIASQDTSHVWLWLRVTRADGTRVFPSDPLVLDSRDDTLAIPAVGFACTVAEIYDGIL